MQVETSRRRRILQLPFGEPPDEYVIKVMQDQRTGAFRWRLERGGGNVEWEENNRDAADIYSLIARRILLKTKGQGASSQFSTLRTSTHKPTLEGNLQEMPMSNLVQSLQMSKGTGRLELETTQGSARAFFVQGELVHCVFNDGEGDDAFLELIPQMDGSFRFYKEPKTSERSITRNLQALLIEGAALSDQLSFLSRIGVKLETYLIRNHSTMSESIFEQMVVGGAACDMALQKRFFTEVDNQSTILEILRRHPLSKPRWVPIVFNLVTCGLCSYRDKVPDLSAEPRDANIDWSQVKRVEAVLKRPDTGVYTYPAFLLFLEKEFFRYERFKREFAVVTLDIKVRRKGGIEPLPVQALSEVVERVKRLIRRTDMLFHYETLGFAILMPETGLDSAKTFALRLAEILMSKPLTDDQGGFPIMASVGFAAIPESCESLGALMAMARAPSR